MYQNKQFILTNPLLGVKNLLAGLLSFGVILASTHGALLPGQHVDLSLTDFKAKVASDLHIHSDLQLQHNHILIDPRHLRNTRSEGDKVAENDSLRGNWDVYQV